MLDRGDGLQVAPKLGLQELSGALGG